MDNKLSELSKPVMYVVRTLDGSVASVKNYKYTAPKGFTSNPLYSQEYVSALLAELESKSAYAADWCHLATKRKDELGDANKRIAELEAIRSDASLAFKEIGNELGCNPDNESIMMAIDDLKANQMTGPLKDVLRRNIELEKRLATPVRLLGEMIVHDWEHRVERQAAFEHGKIAWDARLEEDKKAILAAGFTFTVEGDE